MRIGELAEVCRVDTRTIRFYERRGLIPEPPRTPSGYRDYDRSAVARLGFVRSAQASGLSLKEIKEIVDLSEAGQTPCVHVGQLLEQKLAEVRERRAQLDEMEEGLVALIDRSRVLDPADCRPESVCHVIEPRSPTGRPTGLRQ